MGALVNLLSIIAVIAFTIWLSSFPEKKYLKGRGVWSLAVWEFRIEFPYKPWLIPAVGILQLVFSVGTLFLFTTLFGKYFAGANPILPSQFIILTIPLFFLGIGFPVGLVEMIKGMSINAFGKYGRNFKNVFIADEFRKIGLLRVASYIIALMLMFIAFFILQRIYV